MLSDEQRAAFHAWYLGLRDGEHTHYQAFAAGIAYAQTWRSMESAPKDGTPILVRGAPEADGGYVIGIAAWNPDGDSWVESADGVGSATLEVTGIWTCGGGWFQPNEVTGWLPLPPTEAK